MVLPGAVLFSALQHVYEVILETLVTNATLLFKPELRTHHVPDVPHQVNRFSVVSSIALVGGKKPPVAGQHG